MGMTMSAAARKLCRQFGITLKPNHEHCREMESHCINVIPQLMEKHGVDTMVLTLRELTETNPRNRHQLNRDVITAVNAVCRSKRWTSLAWRFWKRGTISNWASCARGRYRPAYGFSRAGGQWPRRSSVLLRRGSAPSCPR